MIFKFFNNQKCHGGFTAIFLFNAFILSHHQRSYSEGGTPLPYPPPARHLVPRWRASPLFTQTRPPTHNFLDPPLSKWRIRTTDALLTWIQTTFDIILPYTSIRHCSLISDTVNNGGNGHFSLSPMEFIMKHCRTVSLPKPRLPHYMMGACPGGYALPSNSIIIKSPHKIHLYIKFRQR